MLLEALIDGISIKHVLVFEHIKNSSLKFLRMNYSHSFEMKLFMLAMVSLVGNKACLMMKGREAKKSTRKIKKARCKSDRDQEKDSDGENEEAYNINDENDENECAFVDENEDTERDGFIFADEEDIFSEEDDEEILTGNSDPKGALLDLASKFEDNTMDEELDLDTNTIIEVFDRSNFFAFPGLSSINK